MTLVLTRHLQARDNGESVLLWNTFFGSPLIVAMDTFRKLQSGNHSTLSVHDFNKLTSHRILVEHMIDEEAEYWEKFDREFEYYHSLSNLKTLMLVMTDTCNLACHYCMFRKVAGASRRHLTPSEAIRGIETAHALFRRDDSKLNVTFSGGEPTLVWPSIVEVVDWGNSTDWRENIQFNLLSNGTLIHDEIADFLAANGVHVYLSLDGVGEIHRQSRPMNGGDSFARLHSSIGILRRHGVVIESIQTTVPAFNVDALDDSLLEYVSEYAGVKRMGVELDLTSAYDGLSSDLMAEKLVQLFFQAVRRGIDLRGFWLRPYASLFHPPHAKNRLTWCGATLGSGITLTPSLTWKPCPYVEDSFGKLDDEPKSIANSWTLWVEGYLKEQRTRCQGCLVETACRGGCLVGQDTSSILEFRCDLYRSIFELLIQHHLRGDNNPLL